MIYGFPGHDLRLRREELGFTVEDIYRKTRIPRQVVDALEKGDLANLPAACYTLGFIRSYCAFIALDPERYMDSYRACVRPVAWFRFRKQSIEVDAKGMPLWARKGMMWLPPLALFALLWFTYATVFQPPDRTQVQRTNAETIDVPTPPRRP